MRTIKLTISYDGTDYVGWQNQPNGLSVQECIEKALSEMNGTHCPVTGAGRTDAGVHAIGQVAHFKTDSSIPCHGFASGLNSLLPESIAITSAEDMEETFHARHDAKGKIYRYLIALCPNRIPLLKNRCWQMRKSLDLDAMRVASSNLIGENDYESFRAAGCGSKHAVREIKRIEISEPVIATGCPGTRFLSSLRRQGSSNTDNFWIPAFAGMTSSGSLRCNLLAIEFEGDGFVRHMIRNIVGTLVDIGRGKIAADEIKSILDARQREKAGRCAPASGLYLVQVFY